MFEQLLFVTIILLLLFAFGSIAIYGGLFCMREAIKVWYEIKQLRSNSQ